MLTALLFVCQFVLFVYGGPEAVSGITCMCSTTHCVEHQMTRCNTTGMCFSQYLDRKDGSHPVVRGCIGSKTPLLCENRRPAIAGGSWPVLLCCDSNLCNQDVVPTPQSVGVANRSPEAEDHDDKEQPTEPTFPTPMVTTDDSALPSQKDKEKKNSSAKTSSFPKIVSPVYISVLVLGVVSLVVIGIVAAAVLRRNNKFYGALERTDDLSKHSVDIEESPCRHQHAHPHYIYQVKDLANT